MLLCAEPQGEPGDFTVPLGHPEHLNSTHWFYMNVPEPRHRCSHIPRDTHNYVYIRMFPTYVHVVVDISRSNTMICTLSMYCYSLQYIWTHCFKDPEGCKSDHKCTYDLTESYSDLYQVTSFNWGIDRVIVHLFFTFGFIRFFICWQKTSAQFNVQKSRR